MVRCCGRQQSRVFFGFLRSGEITILSDSSFDEGAHLSFHDVAVDCLSNPQILRMHLKASKTDPFQVGINIFIGKTDNSLCPVAAALSYMVERGADPGLFFHFHDGKPLTRMLKGKKALTTAGIDCTAYSGHSFRSGAATTVAKQGILDATIKMLGRWKSSAYQLYVKTTREQLAGYSRSLSSAF